MLSNDTNSELSELLYQVQTISGELLAEPVLDDISVEKLSQLHARLDTVERRIRETDNTNLNGDYQVVLKAAFELMAALMRRIPDENYYRYRSKITTEPYIDKHQLLNAMENVLTAKLIHSEPSPLVPSGVFSPASAAFSSAASFERQFMNRASLCTLVDLYCLFKTNILNALKILDIHSQLNSDKLSSAMLHAYLEIEHTPVSMREDIFPANIICLREYSDSQEMCYTISLAFHAVSVTLTHQKDTPSMHFHLEFFGEPRDRLELMTHYVTSYLALCANSISLEPYYSNDKWHFECQFDVDATDKEAISDAINMINAVARMSFSDRKIELHPILLSALHSKKSGEALSDPLLKLVCLCQGIKTSFPKKEDVLLFGTLLNAKELNQATKEKISSLFITKLTKVLLNDSEVCEALQGFEGVSSSASSSSSSQSKRLPTQRFRKR